MKKKRKLSIILFLMFIKAMFFLYPSISLSVDLDEPCPSFTQMNTLEDKECDYLGIECEKEFSLKDLHHDVVVLEFLNVYCDTCKADVEIYNDLFLRTQNDPDFLDKACVIGIAVGNSYEEVIAFKEEQGVQYPVLIDPDKAIFQMTGNVRGAPHTDVLKKDQGRFILKYHAWGSSSKDRYNGVIKAALGNKSFGVEMGNLIPKYSFAAAGKDFNEKHFKGKKVILYFPANRQYPLAMDMRNVGNQIEILKLIQKKHPSISIIVFEPPDLSLQDYRNDKSSSIIFGKPSDKPGSKDLASHDRPTIYHINEKGMIVFKGEAITQQNLEAMLKETGYRPVPDLTEKEIVYRIEAHIQDLGNRISATEKYIMDNGETIYVTALAPKSAGLFLFSRLESCPSLCDVCHDSHFIYIIDQQGTILDFIPVDLTKKVNYQWSLSDVAKVKDTFAGKNIFSDFDFNQKVDAVSSATMTTSLVYDAFNKGKKIFNDFKDFKFRYEHWKQVCFKNYCKIKQKIAQIKKLNEDFILNDESLAELISKNNLPTCPLHGIYVVLDGDIICSVFGMHIHNCE